jgi:hypothetical protein
MKRRHLNSFIAIFFILFTAVDLLNPHICSEELGGVSFGGALTANLSAGDTKATAIVTPSEDSHPEQPSRPGQTEEDCFCCCSHILPGSYFSPDAGLLKPDVGSPMNSNLPNSPPRDLFRPPRLS